LGWEKLQTKLLEKIKTHFISQTFFSNIMQFTRELQVIRQRNRVKKINTHVGLWWWCDIIQEGTIHVT
jgi:hypothetical protein